MQRQKLRSNLRKKFGHRNGRSSCAHSIGKFFLCYIVLFSFETSATGSPGNYLYYYHLPFSAGLEFTGLYYNTVELLTVDKTPGLVQPTIDAESTCPSTQMFFSIYSLVCLLPVLSKRPSTNSCNCMSTSAPTRAAATITTSSSSSTTATTTATTTTGTRKTKQLKKQTKNQPAITPPIHTCGKVPTLGMISLTIRQGEVAMGQWTSPWGN